MGKLQYANRKIDGWKLGETVAKDLRKRAPPGLGSKTALRDPQVELDLTNKGIDDLSCNHIVEALVAGISNPAGTTKLEELKLKENGLTAKSLRPLARVVRAAARDLRDLDLSHNKITISTAEDAAAWEEFLSAFSRCVVMRRLDLSGNELGLKGFEVLSKVYLREDVLGSGLDVWSDVGLGSGAGSTESLIDNIDNTDIDDGSADSEIEVSTPLVPRQLKSTHSSPDRPGAIPQELMTKYCATSGLRAVPYLCLFNCDLTDGCAMYLSYVVEHHALVAELLEKVPPPKPGAQASQIEAYDMVPGCNGVIWKPNPRVGRDGSRALELAEQARINVSEDIDDMVEEALTISPMPVPRKAVDTPSPFTPITNRQRRGSMSSGTGSPFPTTPGALKANTLEAVRNRIQVEVIKEFGAKSNDLWRTALEMLATCRSHLATQEAQLPVEDDRPKELEDSRGVRGLEMPATPTPMGKILESPAESRSPSPSNSIWPKLPSSNVENKPPQAKHTLVFRLNTNRYGQSGLERDHALKLKVPMDNAPSNGIIQLCEVTPPTRRAPRLERKQFRANLVGGLNEKLWGRIVNGMLGDQDALSPAQQSQVVKYASSRKSLEQEIQRLGKLEQAQIWKVLEQMGCLSYA